MSYACSPSLALLLRPTMSYSCLLSYRQSIETATHARVDRPNVQLLDPVVQRRNLVLDADAEFGLPGTVLNIVLTAGNLAIVDILLKNGAYSNYAQDSYDKMMETAVFRADSDEDESGSCNAGEVE